MSRLSTFTSSRLFVVTVVLPIALIAELFLLEGSVGISLPSDRSSARSSYEIREQGRGTHFITHNRRFSLVDVRSANGSALQTLALRESFDTDREDGIEGSRSTVKVEALEGDRVLWSFEGPGGSGRPMNQMYEVIELGCCGSPRTYTYFSLRDGKKLKTVHTELTRDEFEALDRLLYY
jgi:hypothetical protein